MTDKVSKDFTESPRFHAFCKAFWLKTNEFVTLTREEKLIVVREYLKEMKSFTPSLTNYDV